MIYSIALTTGASCFVQDILAVTLRTPSSFNTQPWACVVVRDAAQREALAQAMLGANAAKVR
jgi:nitroreductase